MSEVQARLRAALVAIAEEDVNALYEEEIEYAIATLDDGIRREEDAQGTVSGACAAVGRLDLLVEARALGYPWNAKTCDNAARYGHLECLEYAHERGCPWDEETCWYAAENGHLECLKYAHEHGCPWNEEMCKNAAEKGHLECLKYAREHRCPWDKDECIDAALAYGNTACLTYMRTLKDAVESKLDDAMSALDEIARDIPEGAYVTICAALKLSHDEHKKRKR